MTTAVAFAVDMTLIATFLVIALLAARHWGEPGVVPFVVLAILFAALSAGVALGREGIAPESSRPFVLFIPFVFASLAWVVLAFEYTGRGPVITRRRAIALTLFGVAVIALTLTGSVFPSLRTSFLLLLINVFQVALVTAVGYGAFLVIRSAVSYDDLPRSGSLVLTTVGGALIAMTVILALVPSLSYESAFAALQGILGGVAVLLLLTQVRYRVFESGPSAGHLARETVLDEMPGSVAITGREGQILDVNRTANRTFDVTEQEALGEPIADVLDLDPAGADGQAVETVAADGQRQFELERSELTRRGGETVGHAYLLRDVTERQTHEQRLNVLNRVLRHNLRNELDAIRGFAEALERPPPDTDRTELAGEIQETATDLAALGATLAQAERLLDAERPNAEPVDVAALTRQVLATISDVYPEVSSTISTSEPTTVVRTDRGVLETILRETIENAFEHNDSDTPTVEITVTDEDPGAVIDVADDGPGIPNRERAVLLEGEETPLRHGSGLGLWLVYWGVARLAGDLEFHQNEPRGSVVSVRIPDQNPAPNDHVPEPRPAKNADIE